MERSKLIKLIMILAAVLLVAVVVAIIIFGAQNAPSVTEPSGSNPLSGEIIPGTVGTDDPSNPQPSGDVGVGIWDEDPTDGDTDPSDGVTDPTDGTTDPTDGTTAPTDPSGDVDVGIWDDPTTAPTTQPTQPTQPVTPPADGQLTWEQYLALSSEQRYEYYKTFESMDAFFDWKNAAEEAYNATHTIPTIDGNIDLGDIIGGNG